MRKYIIRGGPRDGDELICAYRQKFFHVPVLRQTDPEATGPKLAVELEAAHRLFTYTPIETKDFGLLMPAEWSEEERVQTLLEYLGLGDTGE